MTSPDDLILFDCTDGIARIRFNRTEAGNSFNQAMALRFLAICRSVVVANGVRIVVLSGAGDVFMAGGDLVPLYEDPSRAAQSAEKIITPLQEALSILVALPQPVVASVHGIVAGAGVSIALACDLCIAASDTKFNLAYAQVGTSPDASLSWSLPRVIGVHKALELLLLAETFDAAEALRLGVVNRVVSPDHLVDETEVLACRLAVGPSYAYGQIKRLVRSSFECDIQTQMAAERKAYGMCTGTRDFAEGLNAFFEKRTPQFLGF